jgi:phage terminase large subunit-like protein
MDESQRLEELKAKAEAEGWDYLIRTKSDERALLDGCYFDKDTAEDVCFFIENFIHLNKSRNPGEKFKLLDFQRYEIIYPLFGWLRPDGSRRFRRAYIQLPKKNAKSTIGAAIGAYMLLGDGEQGSEVYCCANSQEQAKIVWQMAADMVETSPVLMKQLKQGIVHSTCSIVKDSTSWFRAWSNERSTKDGPIIHCAILDELHEWKGNSGREFYDKIKYGGVARRQPLCPLVITTAGSDRHGICFDQYQYAKKILNGTLIDKQVFCLIYEADEKRIKEEPDYWKSREAREAANPGLGTILDEEDFLSDIAEAENNPTALNGFLRYRLNVWVQAENPWIDLNVWRNNVGVVDEEHLIGAECYTGMDLASTRDTTAIVHCFPIREKSGKIKSYKFIPRVFVPEESAEDAIRKNVVAYDEWIRSGHIFVTPGNCIDRDYVYNQLERDAKKFKIKELAYDRALSVAIIPQINDEMPEIELIPFGQGWMSMSDPIKSLYEALMKGIIEHGAHPVLEYMAGNAVAKMDDKENITLTKAKSTGKIDAIVAMVMAFAQASKKDLKIKPVRSIYGSENFDEVMKEIMG